MTAATGEHRLRNFEADLGSLRWLVLWDRTPRRHHQSCPCVPAPALPGRTPHCARPQARVQAPLDRTPPVPRLAAQGRTHPGPPPARRASDAGRVCCRSAALLADVLSRKGRAASSPRGTGPQARCRRPQAGSREHEQSVSLGGRWSVRWPLLDLHFSLLQAPGSTLKDETWVLRSRSRERLYLRTGGMRKGECYAAGPRSKPVSRGGKQDSSLRERGLRFRKWR